MVGRKKKAIRYTGVYLQTYIGKTLDQLTIELEAIQNVINF